MNQPCNLFLRSVPIYTNILVDLDKFFLHNKYGNMLLGYR